MCILCALEGHGERDSISSVVDLYFDVASHETEDLDPSVSTGQWVKTQTKNQYLAIVTKCRTVSSDLKAFYDSSSSDLNSELNRSKTRQPSRHSNPSRQKHDRQSGEAQMTSLKTASEPGAIAPSNKDQSYELGDNTTIKNFSTTGTQKTGTGPWSNLMQRCWGYIHRRRGGKHGPQRIKAPKHKFFPDDESFYDETADCYFPARGCAAAHRGVVEGHRSLIFEP